MAGVRFYLKDTKKQEAQIYLYVTYATGKRLRYYTGLTVPPEFWNTENQLIKASRLHPQHPEKNALLRKLANEAERIISSYRNNNATLTDAVFKNELNAFRKKKGQGETQLSFLQFFEKMIQEREGNPDKYKKGSIKVYRTTYNKLVEYGRVNRRKIDFSDFDYEFFNAFANYLFANNFQPNYVHKITSTLKSFLKEADRREVSSDLKYKDDWVPVKRQESEAIYLKPEELDTLYQLDLSKNEKLDRVRDLFLIGCYTGLRFSDFCKITPEKITKLEGKPALKIKTQKTSIYVTVPLKSVVKEILEKHDYKSPKVISNQKMSDYLKELGKLAGLNDLVVMNSYEGGSRHELKYPKYELITTHTARRSFATNAYYAGLPARSIMSITGHKTEKEFRKYIKLDSDEHATLMMDHPFFE